jgi:hypothetical protein
MLPQLKTQSTSTTHNNRNRYALSATCTLLPSLISPGMFIIMGYVDRSTDTTQVQRWFDFTHDLFRWVLLGSHFRTWRVGREVYRASCLSDETTGYSSCNQHQCSAVLESFDTYTHPHGHKYPHTDHRKAACDAATAFSRISSITEFLCTSETWQPYKEQLRLQRRYGVVIRSWCRGS